MDELLNRVRSATGPDRELDTALWLRFTPGATYKTTRAKHTATGKEWDITEARVNGGRLEEVPAFSASLDAALALVELMLPGWGAEVGYPARLGQHGGRPWADVWASRDDSRYPWAARQMRPTPCHSNAATPALAILAALLRALQAQPNRHDARDGASQKTNPKGTNNAAE